MVHELARRSSYFGRVFSTEPACPQRGAPCKGSPRPSGGRPQMCVLSLFSDLFWNLTSKTHMCPFNRRVFSTKLLSNVRFIFVFRLILKFNVKNSHVPIQSSSFFDQMALPRELEVHDFIVNIWARLSGHNAALPVRAFNRWVFSLSPFNRRVFSLSPFNRRPWAHSIVEFFHWAHSNLELFLTLLTIKRPPKWQKGF